MINEWQIMIKSYIEIHLVSDSSGSLYQVCDDLTRIFQVRALMVDVYEKLCNLASTAFLSDPFSETLPSLSSVLAQLKQSRSSVSAPWVTSLQYEVGALLDFLTVVVTMQEYNYFDSIMLLQRAGATLASWDEVVQAR